MRLFDDDPTDDPQEHNRQAKIRQVMAECSPDAHYVHGPLPSLRTQMRELRGVLEDLRDALEELYTNWKENRD